MLTNVSDPPSRHTAVVAAVLLLLVAFAPMLLLGESLSAFGLIVTGAGLTGVGLLARAGRGGDARTFGTVLVILGALTLAAGIALLVLVMGGLRRGI
jgi:drug/metabolite transporter (DMT)-like permease